MEMTTPQLRQITHFFPNADTESAVFCEQMARLLRELPHSEASSERIMLRPIHPLGALPITSVQFARVLSPMIVFSMEQQFTLHIGDFSLRSASYDGWFAYAPAKERRDRAAAREAPGVPIVLSTEHDNFTDLVAAEELYNRLHGHVVHLDHTGVIIPMRSVPRTAWDTLISTLATATNCYRYPTGEEWPFILPSTDTEFATDIAHFTARRAPKFELVYDGSLRDPLIQFDLQTDLTREEVEQRFPEPYGKTLPGLAHFFRSVYLSHPWPALSLRIDLRYCSDGPPSEWDTGEWLVTAGRRIRE